MKTSSQSAAGDADWWRLWPGTYEAELEAFSRHHAPVKTLNARNGLLVLEVLWPLGDGGTIRLHVGFSPLHPSSRPAVAAPDLKLARHQNPFTGALCLLTQASGQWYPGQFVADYIAEQLPRALRAVSLRGEGRCSEAANLEEQTPDPLSPYFAHAAEEHSAVFFSADQRVPQRDVGVATFVKQDRTANGAAFQAVLRSVEPLDGPWLAKPFDLPKPVGPWTKIPGRWVRLKPPITSDADELLATAEKEIARLTALRPREAKRLQTVAENDCSITAILFDEELAYGPDKNGNGWLFLVTRRDATSKRRRDTKLIRGYRIADDLMTRLPVADVLRDKKILLVGCGAIGSFVAVELARAGVGTLTIVDHDIVEPGNAVRWALGRQAWGFRKVVALHDFLYRNYPGTDVGVGSFQLGAATANVDAVPDADRNPLAHLHQLIQQADIIVDASASTECQHALAYNAQMLGKPYVFGHATEGAIGGVVARFPANSPACYVCLLNHWRAESLPNAPADPAGNVVPIGCSEPTFTGGSFDLTEVSLEMVRSAIGLLAPAIYDPGDWQLSVLSLKSSGKRLLPSWQGKSIPPHERCCGRPRA